MAVQNPARSRNQSEERFAVHLTSRDRSRDSPHSDPDWRSTNTCFVRVGAKPALNSGSKNRCLRISVPGGVCGAVHHRFRELTETISGTIVGTGHFVVTQSVSYT